VPAQASSGGNGGAAIDDAPAAIDRRLIGAAERVPGRGKTTSIRHGQ
jgi:hypothetical protein